MSAFTKLGRIRPFSFNFGRKIFSQKFKEQSGIKMETRHNISGRVTYPGGYETNYSYVNINRHDLVYRDDSHSGPTRSNSRAQSFWCNICNKMFESNEALREHSWAAHPEVAVRIEQLTAELARTDHPLSSVAINDTLVLATGVSQQCTADLVSGQFSASRFGRTGIGYSFYARYLEAGRGRFPSLHPAWGTALNWIARLAAFVMVERH